MSRGPGKWQRAILDALDNSDGGVVITRPDNTPAVKSAVRRAASKLEDAGKLVLVPVRFGTVNRLVAYKPDDAPTITHRTVTGMDGKTYRVP